MGSERPQSPSHASSRSFCTACGSTEPSSTGRRRRLPRNEQFRDQRVPAGNLGHSLRTTPLFKLRCLLRTTRRLEPLTPETTSFRLFGFELQGRCSAFTSWRARKRDPKTFSLAAHNQGLVLRHMTFGLQQLFQISLERGLCFNHGIEGLLHLGRQIICIDVLPLQFFPCHCLAPAWSDEKGIRYSS